MAALILGAEIPRYRKIRTRNVLAVLACVAASLVPATAAAPEPVEAVDTVPPVQTAPGWTARYLAPPNPLNSTEGMILDGKGGLYICQALNNRVVRMDLATRELTVIADEFDAEPLLVPDDIALGPDGNLYVTNLLGRNVTRMAPDGTQRKVVANNIGDGKSLANAVAFNAQGRLFATDLSFADPNYPGGFWEVDPEGVKPPVPLVRNLPAPNGFAFGADGRAYVPMMFGGRIDAIDVDTGAVETVADGFGYLTSVEFDGQGRVITHEADTGKVWRVDLQKRERSVLAQGDVGLDNIVVFPDGEIWVSNFVRGNVRRVDEERGVLQPILPERPLSLPFTLNEAPDGSLVVGDFTAVSRLDAGEGTRLSRLLVNDLQLLTPGAVQISSDLYWTDFLPPDGRVFRRDLETGERVEVATGFGFPWSIEEGPLGNLLVTDQALGTVFEVDTANGMKSVLASGLRSPSGLAYSRSNGTVYVSDTGGGRVLAIDVVSRMPRELASGLAAPEGLAVDRDGTVLVVEGDAGRLLRLAPGGGGAPEVVASGLPTRTIGIGLPLLNYSADVLVRSDGLIVVSGPADGSVIEIAHSPS
jgi:sugar lactone lactonase YvrE